MTSIDNEVNDDDEYEDILVYLSYPDFDNLSFINKSNKIDINISQLFDEFPRCIVNDCEFIGKHQPTLGTRLFIEQNVKKEDSITIDDNNTNDIDNSNDNNTNNVNNNPKIIEISNQCINFQLRSFIINSTD